MVRREDFETAGVAASTLLPLTIHLIGLQLTITRMQHGKPPRAKTRTSGVNYFFQAELNAASGVGRKLTWGPNYESLRGSTGADAIDDGALGQAVYEACNWLVHAFDLELPGNKEWAPAMAVRLAARRAFAPRAFDEERRWPDQGTPDLPASLFASVGPMAVRARAAQPTGPLHVWLDGDRPENSPTATVEPARSPASPASTESASGLPSTDQRAADVGPDTPARLVEASDPYEAVIPAVYDNSSEADELVERLRLAHLAQGAASPARGVDHPERVPTTVDRFKTSADVRAKVFALAGDRCESCGQASAFSKIGGFSYWELHHVQPLAENGADSEQNAVCICANCHRALHFAEDRDARRADLYRRLGRLEPSGGARAGDLEPLID